MGEEERNGCLLIGNDLAELDEQAALQSSGRRFSRQLLPGNLPGLKAAAFFENRAQPFKIRTLRDSLWVAGLMILERRPVEPNTNTSTSYEYIVVLNRKSHPQRNDASRRPECYDQLIKRFDSLFLNSALFMRLLACRSSKQACGRRLAGIAIRYRKPLFARNLSW